MFRKSILKAKKKSRLLEYVSFKDFINESDFILDEKNLVWFAGNYSIPSQCLFYNNILINNNIDILDKKKVIKFFISKNGKYILSSEFTKIYIVPVRKALRKHKIFDKLIFKLLVRVKVFDKDKYLDLVNSKDLNYHSLLFKIHNYKV